jgi:hypothetical protein
LEVSCKNDNDNGKYAAKVKKEMRKPTAQLDIFGNPNAQSTASQPKKPSFCLSIQAYLTP